MEESLLTKEEIELILHEARFSLLNNPGFVSKFTKAPNEIFSISPVKKLIFIQGDKDTGLKHIRQRHGFYTNEHSKRSI